MNPKGKEEEELVLLGSLKRGETTNAYDAVRTRKDGQNIDVSVSMSPIFDPLGNLVGASKVARDITDRKQMETELEVRRAQAVASARLSALGMMAAGIAHEINNPLAVIHASASDLMEMAETGTVPLKALEAASTRIRQTADRISKIVKSLRQTAREGSTDPFQRASVGEIVEQALELCKERFRVHSVQLETPIVDPALHISCREVQIVQVLLNLLQNAFDAVVECEGDRWIRLDVACSQHSAVFDVIDSGPGVPPELRPRIMEPFFTTNPLATGTHLGLSLSKAIVDEHGGEQNLCEKKHSHLLFSSSSPFSRSPKMHLKDATILLVDDEPDLRTIIAEWFKREGSRVLVAEDGAEALNIIQANHGDVVVSDVRKPVIHGITLLKH